MWPEASTAAELASVGKIVLFDLVLSGDNAVVIGLAAHRLPPAQRKAAIFWGCGLGVVLRLVLAMAASALLAVPGLRLAGALALAWVAAKLLMEEVHPAEDPADAPTSFLRALRRIVAADVVMSLDNVLAVAGAAEGDPIRVALGLALSIALLLILSPTLARLLDRHRWVAYAGAALLAWTAADMTAGDLPGLLRRESDLPARSVWALRLGFVALCLTADHWLPSPASAPRADEPKPAS